MKAVVIYNPVSGSGTSQEVSLLAEEHLRVGGWSVERVATRADTWSEGDTQEVLEGKIIGE